MELGPGRYFGVKSRCTEEVESDFGLGKELVPQIGGSGGCVVHGSVGAVVTSGAACELPNALIIVCFH